MALTEFSRVCLTASFCVEINEVSMSSSSSSISVTTVAKRQTKTYFFSLTPTAYPIILVAPEITRLAYVKSRLAPLETRPI